MSKRERKPFVWRGWADPRDVDEEYLMCADTRGSGDVRVTVREVLPRCKHPHSESFGGWQLGYLWCRLCGSFRTCVTPTATSVKWSRWRKPRRA